MVRMRILITGFEPFGADSENASQSAVDLLADRWSHESVQLLTGILPVEFGRAGTALHELVARYRPDAVIAVGEAGGRSRVTPEARGVNEMDARIPDNAGLQPRSEAIFPAGPAERPATLDVQALADAADAAGVPAEVSEDAGRFVCNYVAYLLGGIEVPAAFVHVPAVRSAGTATVGGETDAVRAPAVDSSDPVLGFDDLATALEAIALDAARQVG